MSEHNITITDSAAKRINFLSKKDGREGLKLRVMVDTGGCSGFQYQYNFVTKQEKDDAVITNGEAMVLVDKLSIPFMKNCSINYVQNLGNAYFEIKNPNATANCGCGNSFSV